MTTLHARVAEWSQWGWPLLADHLWQATLWTVVALGVAALLLRGAPARARHALWLLASAKFIVPSALLALPLGAAGLNLSRILNSASAVAETEGVPVLAQLASPLARYAAGANVKGISAAVAGSPHSEWYCVLTVVWLAGSFAFAFSWWMRRRAFIRALRAGRGVRAGREADALKRVQGWLGQSGRRIELVTTPHQIEPGVWRTRRPVIVLPENISEHLNDAELEALMMHELVHIERRDNLVSSLHMSLCCLFWFHPLLWFANRQILDERERACDEKVLELCGAREVYASSILKVVRFCFGWKVAGVSGVTGSDLRRRIDNIMSQSTGQDRATRSRVLVGVFASALVIVSVLVGHTPGYVGDVPVLGQQRQRERTPQPMIAVSERGEVLEARGDTASQETLRELSQAPDIPVVTASESDSPLLISNASMKLITREQFQRFMGDRLKISSAASEHLTLPRATLRNLTDKRISLFWLGFLEDGRLSVTLEFASPIEPHADYQLQTEWGKLNAVMERGAENLVVQVLSVRFEDGSTWGAKSFPRVPVRLLSPDGSPFAHSDERSLPRMRQQPEALTGSMVMSRRRTGGGDGGGGPRLQDKVIDAPHPTYPPIARAAGAEGTVVVEVMVDEAGNVTAAEAVSGHPLLRDAAVEAARKSKFEPTTQNGQPVKVAGKLSYEFIIQ